MNKKVLNNFYLLLAGSKLSMPEIADLLSQLRYENPTSLQKKIRSLRELASYKDDIYDEPPKSKKSIASSSPLEISQQINDILKIECGLPTKLALDLLLMELHLPNRFQSNFLATLPPKAPFTESIRRLADELPVNELLKAALNIRNRLAHNDPRNDWPLKTSKKNII